MPELPEVEIIARRLSDAVTGAVVQSARATGVGTLKSFDPPLSLVEGAKLSRIRRRGKLFLIEFDSELTLLVHLMSAGRLQLFARPASPRDRTVRLLLRFVDGRELRLREFGTRQSAWAKLLRRDAVEQEEAVATLGPEAWPQPPPLEALLSEPRLHSLLRDQRVIAGIGRSWADEILHAALLSPFKRGNTLTPAEAGALRQAIAKTLAGAIAQYEKTVHLPLPDKLPMPLIVHGRNGLPCPRCETVLEAVHFEDHVVSYCPSCQTGGKALKDRRLSRLLK